MLETLLGYLDDSISKADVLLDIAYRIRSDGFARIVSVVRAFNP